MPSTDGAEAYGVPTNRRGAKRFPRRSACSANCNTAPGRRRWRAEQLSMGAAFDDPTALRAQDLVGPTIVDRRCAMVSGVAVGGDLLELGWISFSIFRSGAGSFLSKMRCADSEHRARCDALRQCPELGRARPPAYSSLRQTHFPVVDLGKTRRGDLSPVRGRRERCCIRSIV
jgi:hypothetical protein